MIDMKKILIQLSGDKYHAQATIENVKIMSLGYCDIQMDWCFQEYVPFFKKDYCDFYVYEKGINPIEKLKDILTFKLKMLNVNNYEIIS